MSEFLSSIFSLALSPFSSESLLVVIPAGFAYIFGCVSIVFALIRRL